MAAAGGTASSSSPIRIAIVGGGVGGLTAAYELSGPEHLGRYEITVYQLGFRLGGKGAAGHNLDAANRIEEHGLHVWMGFYENAFRMLRACYAELKDRREDATRPPRRRKYPGAPVPPPSVFEHWTDAFFADSHIGVASDTGHGEWDAWTAWFPPMEGLPGDPLDPRHNPFTLPNYLSRTLLLLRTLMLSTLRSAGDSSAGRRSPVDEALDKGEDELVKLSPRLLVESMMNLLRVGALTTAAGAMQALLILETALKARASLPGKEYLLLEFVDALASSVRRQLEDVVRIDPRLRRKTEVIDLVMTTVVGIVRDGLLTQPEGLDAINDFDAREWLERHGATRSSLDSPIMRGLYDMAFADVPVEGRRQGLAAGQALRCALRMFYTYRGALFWRMRSSLADVVFAPMYDLLKARGVHFEFFHRLEEVHVDTADPDNAFVDRLVFHRQASLARGRASYEPLMDIACTGAGEGAKIRAWPARPDYAQLAADTDRDQDFESPLDRRYVGAPRVLEAGRDFHMAVLAVGLGAVRCLKGNLVEQPRWKAMQQHVKTVATQAFQLWMRKDMASLGWTEPPLTLSGFAKPFDTWCDMTHIVPAENWTVSPMPLSVAYLCGARPELPHPADSALWKKYGSADLMAMAPRERARALQEIRDEENRLRDALKNDAIAFLETHMHHLWPEVRTRSGGFDWSVLVDAKHPDEPDPTVRAFDSQFWSTCVNPSDRYVLTVPGSTAYRISPLDDTYANLTVAGDWTDCSFHGGCIEAAVISGRLASHALTGLPLLEDIVAFDHP